MRKLYNGTINLAERMTTGVFDMASFFCHTALSFMALLLFGFFLITMWILIIGVPLLLVHAIASGMGLL